MSAHLAVLQPGLATTVQDLGRVGSQHLGVPVAGALDTTNLVVANRLAGNPAGAAALEIAYKGPVLRIEADSARVALAGGTAPVEIMREEGAPAERVPAFTSLRLKRGEVLRIGAVTGSPIAYLAVEGGIDVAPVLGSRSTYLRAALGGYEGRPLRPGDLLPLARADVPERDEIALPGVDLAQPKRVRVVLGPQDDYFTAAGIATFLSGTYQVTAASDRMGMRLEGPVIEHAKGYNIVSDGIAPGSIQVPGIGQPIVLLADRQTTGGYPKIATVISADLPALGRLAPGSRLAFESVTLAAAREARREAERQLAALVARIGPAAANAIPDAARLLAANLVSGVFDASQG